MVLIPSPALAADPSWEEIKRLEITYDVLNVADLVETESCLHAHTCVEGNPILGHHPSLGKLLVAKIAFSGVHYYASREIFEKHIKLIRGFEYASIAIQGGVVVANLRIVL